MFDRNKKFSKLGGILLVLLACWFVVRFYTPAAAQNAKAEKAELAPVEDDMHEFMEYVFQPTYKQLQQAMKSEPQNGGDWFKVKSGALILAEGGNLILLRGPDSDREAWSAHSVAVRESGGEMYRAAQKKDFEQASKHYRSMLNNCNACHQEFADGEYQLSP